MVDEKVVEIALQYIDNRQISLLSKFIDENHDDDIIYCLLRHAILYKEFQSMKVLIEYIGIRQFIKSALGKQLQNDFLHLAKRGEIELCQKIESLLSPHKIIVLETINHAFLQACKRANVSMVNYLLELGADIKCQNHQGKTTLHLLIEKYFEIEKRRADSKLDLEEKSYFQEQVTNLSSLIHQLIQLNSDISIVDNEYNSPLMLCCQQGDLELALLISNHQTSLSKILLLSARHGYLDIFKKAIEKELIKKENSIHTLISEAMQQAIAYDKSQIVSYILENHLKIIKDESNNYIHHLHLAFDEKKEQCARTIYSFSQKDETFDLEAKYLNREGHQLLENIQEEDLDNNPLINAIKNKDIDLTEIHAANQTLINKKNIDGKTPLFFAAASGNRQLIESLLNHGANINETDNLGNSPLSESILNLEMNATQFLIEHRANLDLVNHQDKNLYHVALSTNNIEIAAFIYDAMQRLGLNPQRKIPASQPEQQLHLSIIEANKNDVGLIEIIKNETIIDKANEVSRFLSDNPSVKIKAIGHNGKNAISIAAEMGLVDICLILLKALDEINEDYLLAHWAAKYDYDKLIHAIFEKKHNEYIALEAHYSNCFYPSAPVISKEQFENLSLENTKDELDDSPTEIVATPITPSPQCSLIDAQPLAFIECENELGQTPLKLAILNKSIKSINCLLNLRVKIPFVDGKMDETVFNNSQVAYAIYRCLREQGYSIEPAILGKNGQSFIHQLSKNHPPFSQLENGLFKMVEKNDFQQLQKSIEKGADFNERDKNGLTVLHRAALRGSINIIKYLDNYSPLQIAIKGLFPIHYASRAAYNNQHKDLSQYLEVIRFLYLKMEKPIAAVKTKEHEHYVRFIKEEYATRLKEIALKNDVNELKKFIGQGVDVNEKENLGNNAFLSAVSNDVSGSLEKAIGFLIANGADVNSLTSGKENALTIAALNNNVSLFGFLLEKCVKLDLNHKNLLGQSALMIAIKSGFSEIVTLCLEYQNKNSTCANSALPIFDFFLEDNRGFNILHLATSLANETLVNKLVLHFNMPINSKNRFGKTPLHVATESMNLAMISLTIGLGGNIYEKDSFLKAPIDIAISSNRKDIITFFSYSLVSQNNIIENQSIKQSNTFKKSISSISEFRRFYLKLFLNGYEETPFQAEQFSLSDEICQTIKTQIKDNLTMACQRKSSFYQRFYNIAHDYHGKEAVVISQLDELEIEINQSKKPPVSSNESSQLSSSTQSSQGFFTFYQNERNDYIKKQQFRTELATTYHLDLTNSSNKAMWRILATKFSYTNPITGESTSVSQTIKEILMTLDRYQNRFTYDEMIERIKSIVSDSKTRNRSSNNIHLQNLFSGIEELSSQNRPRANTYPADSSSLTICNKAI